MDYTCCLVCFMLLPFFTEVSVPGVSSLVEFVLVSLIFLISKI